MTRVKQKPASITGRRATKPRNHRSGTYVYCILESGNLEGIFDSAPEGLESAKKIEPLLSAGFAAVVSRVPLSDYGQGALDANLSDVNWAASRVMAHERVVEYFASRRDVIPLRFGTIFVDRRSIGRMLAQRSAELTSVMERLRGRQEWGVLIYCDRSRLMETRVANNPGIRALLDRVDSAPPGQAYLVSKQIEGLKSKVAREEISGALVRIREALDASSEQSISTPAAEAGRHQKRELIARLSFLVQSRRFDLFSGERRKAGRDLSFLRFPDRACGAIAPL